MPNAEIGEPPLSIVPPSSRRGLDDSVRVEVKTIAGSYHDLFPLNYQSAEDAERIAIHLQEPGFVAPHHDQRRMSRAYHRELSRTPVQLCVAGSEILFFTQHLPHHGVHASK